MRIVIILILFPLMCFSQVGINTTNPEASLDIRSSNQATPSNIDGILIPKIDEYPASNPTAAQDGMLVYATGNGSVTKGFYYWDNATTSWVTFSGATIEKIDDLVDGKSDNDGTEDGSSIFLGIDAGVNDDGTDNLNVGIGYRALNSNTTGQENTAIGYQALENNTLGVDNVAIGANTLVNNTTGSLNTAVGETALMSNTSGQDNVALGHRALYTNTMGQKNIALGSLSLYDNTLGNYNIAIGDQSLPTNTTGANNISIGANAMYLNTTGNSNTIVGRYALRNNLTGSYNTVLGRNALSLNTIGNYNVALGYLSGYNSTGDNNVFLGYRSGYNETNSNRLYIENSDSTSPLIYGEFDNDLVRTNGDLEVVKTTNSTLKVKTDDGFSSSLSLFEDADYGFELLYSGSDDKLNLWSRTFAGNEGQRMTWLKDGRVGMNDTSPDARLDIEAINQTTPNNTDGILIPRVDTFPATNPGANQNGMLVFLTTDNSFYFWRNSTTSWQKANVERINDLVDGKSDNDGSDNGSSVFLGVNAGANDNETDNDNVGVGYFSLHNNVSGASNTAVGSTALISNTSGSNNSAFGRRALYWSTTGSGNSAFGSLSLEENTTGYSNTAVGYEALTSNTTGYYNTAVGYKALEDNTNGNDNSAFGFYSLSNNISGDYNVAIGNRSLRISTTSSQNTAVGFGALEINYGNYNTAVGYLTLNSNTYGEGNTALGNQAMSSTNTGDYNTSIGYRSMLDNTSGYNNVALGFHALQNNTSASNNVAIGYNALSSITTGTSNTALGYAAGAAGATFYNTTALGNGASPNSPNQVRLGNASVSVIGGYSNWSNFSDRRLKTNIQENVVGLEFIKKLRPVNYNYDMDAIARFENTPDSLRLRDAERLKAQEVQTGFIAQEVEAAANEVGFNFHGVVKPYDANGTYALRYAEFVVPLVKAMQEQQDLIEAQQEELIALKKEIADIKALLKKE